MGNRITSKRNNDPVSVKMNNGLTDAVLCILAVRGSALASTEREKNMMVCFASHDQSAYGRGAARMEKWRQKTLPEFRQCPLHGVYLHRYGCIVCNAFCG
jgi:hypothetical protein